MADVSFQPVDILTGPPQFISVDDSPLYDDTVVTDWYTYFFVIKTSITQAHNLTSVSLQSSSPELQAAALAENYTLSANDLLSGQPVVSSTALVEDVSLSPVGFVSGQPVLAATTLTQNYSLIGANLLVGLPQLQEASLTQAHSLDAEDLETGIPELQEPVDPKAQIQEIEELKEMFGGWPRRNYEVPDGRLVQAEREIELQFGEKVSIDRKAKSLIKFGKSAPLATGSLQTIWTVGGNETYVNDNLIDSISSSSLLDNQEIYLECHTVDENGDFTFLTQTVTLNGRNRVELPVPVARVSMAYNNNGTELLGRVVVYENTPLNNGIPVDTSKIHIDIPLGLQESFKAATTFSSSDYFVLTGGFGSVSLKQDGAADFYLEIREKGKVFRQVAAVSAASASPWYINLDPAVILPKNADIRVRVETDANNVVVFTVFQGYLAKIL